MLGTVQGQVHGLGHFQHLARVPLPRLLEGGAINVQEEQSNRRHGGQIAEALMQLLPQATQRPAREATDANDQGWPQARVAGRRAEGHGDKARGRRRFVDAFPTMKQRFIDLGRG